MNNLKISFETLQLSDLKETNGNPQIMDDHVFSGMVNSMKTKGWILDAPVIWKKAEGDLQILSGHHRVKAGIEAGIKETFCKTVEGLSEEQAKLFILEANQRRGEFDELEFERFISDILRESDELTINDIYSDIGIDFDDPLDQDYIDTVVNEKELQKENDQLTIVLKFADPDEKEEFIEILDRIGGRSRATEQKIKQFVSITLKKMVKEDNKEDEKLKKEMKKNDKTG